MSRRTAARTARWVAVALLPVLAVGALSGCGRLADRRAAEQPAAPASNPAATAPADTGAPSSAPTQAGTGTGTTSGVDPATVQRLEQQVTGAERFLDGAESQLGQD